MTGREEAHRIAEAARTADGHIRIRCRYLRPSGVQCPRYAADPTGDVLLCDRHGGQQAAAVPDTESEPPTVLFRHSHWCRIRWADGREETVNIRTARRLGAVEQQES